VAEAVSEPPLDTGNGVIETFPIYVVCEWIGNSEVIAKDHYLQVTESHFQRAVQPVTSASTATSAAPTNASKSASEKTTQIPTQQAAVLRRNVSHATWRTEKKSHDCGQKQGLAKNREPLRNQGVPYGACATRLISRRKLRAFKKAVQNPVHLPK
jgi:hypothetical protein